MSFLFGGGGVQMSYLLNVGTDSVSVPTYYVATHNLSHFTVCFDSEYVHVIDM